MTKKEFKEVYIDDKEMNNKIPSLGHYRLQVENNKIISFNEMDIKTTKKEYKNLDEFYNSELADVKVSDFIRGLVNPNEILCLD